MANQPQPARRSMTPDEVRQKLEASRKQLAKVVEGRTSQGSRQDQKRPTARQSPISDPFAYGAATRPPRDIVDVFRNPGAAQTRNGLFQDFAARSAVPYSGTGGAHIADAPPPRRSAKIVRVEERSPQYVIGMYGSVTPRTYGMAGDPPPRVTYRPQAIAAKGYDEDVSDADFIAMARKSGFYTRLPGDHTVIGVGAAQGRMIPLALARRLGGYVDPDTGKTMRFPGDYARANAQLDRDGSKEMTRRRDAMLTAYVERETQSPAEQRTWAATRGAGDGVVDGASPLIEAAVHTIARRTPWRDSYAAAKYQRDRDEIEHPYVRNGAKLAAAVLAPSPLGKAKAGGMVAKIGREVAWDAITGTASGGLTTEGDFGDRLGGALKGGVTSVAMGRLADGAVGLAGRRLDGLAPAFWRRATGFDMPATHLVGKALHHDGSTFNGLALRALDDVPTPPGPYLAGLKEALEDTNAARRGGLREIPSATPEGQGFRSDVASLDPYSTGRLQAALSGDPNVINEMILGRYLEGLRRRTGEPIKKVVAESGAAALDDAPRSRTPSRGR